jgi:hypothetical protein
MSMMLLERPAPPAGEWNHSCGPACGNCGNPGNVLEPLTAPAVTGPGEDDDRHPIPATV